MKRCNHVLVQGHTVPHSTAFCPLVSIDPSDVVNSSLRVLTLCLAAIVVPCEQLCVCYNVIHSYYTLLLITGICEII